MRLLAEALVLLVRAYQWTLRPFIGAHCRFEPSCSHYAIDAFRTHGPFRGAAFATRRILRCNPWAAAGHDPVPPRALPPNVQGGSCRCGLEATTP